MRLVGILKGEEVRSASYEECHPKKGEGLLHQVSGILVFEKRSFLSMLVYEQKNDSKLGVVFRDHGLWLNGDSENPNGRAQNNLESAVEIVQKKLYYQTEVPLKLRIKPVCSFKNSLRRNNLEYTHLFYVISRDFNLDPSFNLAFFEEVDYLKRDVLKNPHRYVFGTGLYLDKLTKSLGLE